MTNEDAVSTGPEVSTGEEVPTGDEVSAEPTITELDLATEPDAPAPAAVVIEGHLVVCQTCHASIQVDDKGFCPQCQLPVEGAR